MPEQTTTKTPYLSENTVLNPLARLAIALTVLAGCAVEPAASTRTPTPAQHEEPANSPAPAPAPEMTKATMIPMIAMTDQASDLRSLLERGRDLVAQGEPDTPYWYALEREGGSGQFAIFDLFPHQAGREAHFGGEVAGALAQRAPQLVQGGWDDGVVANVHHYQTIAHKLPEQPVPVTKATYIPLRAAPGQADALADFLMVGCQMVTQGEPGTPYWLALRSEADDHEFAIVDLFPDQAGRDAHFEGEVAAALEDSAPTLVAGGWTAGVLDKVVHFDVVAAK